MLRTLCLLWVFPLAYGQLLDNRSLTGRRHFRHIQVSTGAATTARTLWGAMTFDGTGGYTFQGQQMIGVSPSAMSGSGTYAVEPGGVVTISNPQQSGAVINARLGTTLLIGSTTDGVSGLFDLFVAFPAPASANNALFTGAFAAVLFDIRNGSVAQLSNARFRASPNGQGAFSDLTVSGKSAALGGRDLAQTVTGVTYTLGSDGAGTANFPIPAGGSASTQLLAGAKQLAVSADGNYFLAGSGHDILLGVKLGTGNVLGGLYWSAGMRWENSNLQTSAGAASAAAAGRLTVARRVRTAAGSVDFTGVNSYRIAADGSGSGPELNTFDVAARGEVIVGVASSASQPAYEIFIAVRAPALTGSGVFLHPHGVVNAASFAPGGAPVSPGTFLTLYGAELSDRTDQARAFPFPRSLANVEVLINGLSAPMYYVSPGQVSALVPFGVTGSRATIVVSNNGRRSNTVTVPLARTSPGVFTLEQNGLGDGAVLHADFSVVRPSSPARPGETVLIFLTGLGAVNPPVADGAAPPLSPLSRTTLPVQVYIGGQRAEVTFQGAAPGLAGLYQLNVVIPPTVRLGQGIPVGIETPDAFHDQTDIAIGR